MKKSKIVLSISILLILTGCNFTFPFTNTSSIVSDDSSLTSSRRGATSDDLIYIGEYVKVSDEDADVQMKIIEIISGARANKLLNDSDNGNTNIIIIKFNIKASDLNGRSFNTGQLNMVLKNGLSKIGVSIIDGETILDMISFSNVSFESEGSVDCYAAFSLDIDDCQYLKYHDFKHNESYYFAIR